MTGQTQHEAAPAFDDESRYRAVSSRDARFDGWFVTAVLTTGIYCRPSCPAMTPRRANVVFHQSAAAAQHAGFRACKRCRPDAAPGSPHLRSRVDMAARALRLVEDGLVDREGVGGLARRLGYSDRQVSRVLVAELGVGPQALARAARAQSARLLLEGTTMTMTEVAFATGFSSVRQFNDTIRQIYATTPTRLRQAPGRCRGGGDTVPGALGRPAGDGGSGQPSRTDDPGATVVLRLAVRLPFDGSGILAHLAERAVPGVEEVVAGTYRRTLCLAGGPAVVEVSVCVATTGSASVSARLRLSDVRDLQSAVHRCRRLFDLDADPVAVDAGLSGDAMLAPLVAATPGRRSVGCTDGEEVAVRAFLGQGRSMSAARAVAGHIAGRLGVALPVPDGGLTRLFPSMAAIATAADEDLPMPPDQQGALRALALACAAGQVRLDPGADPAQTHRQLLALPGMGPWAAGYVRLCAFADPDVLLEHDPGVSAGLRRIGITGGGQLAARAAQWSPWRSYVMHHLWAMGRV